MNIKILGVPVFQGCDILGVDQAPEYLRQNHVFDILKERHHVTDLGDVDIKATPRDEMFDAAKDIKYFDVMLDMNQKISDAVGKVIKDGAMPITIGGDHSLGAGSVAGVASNIDGDLGVIWFDAHADLNTPITSPSKNYHGMSFATSLYFGNEQLRSIAEDKPKVKTQNAFLVGARDIDAGEVELIKNQNINCFKADELKRKGVKEVAREIIEKLKSNGVNKVHLSFDLDVFSPEVTQAFNCPVAGGVSLEECLDFISEIASSGMLCSMDYTEYNPKKDIDGSGLMIAREIFTTLNNILPL